MEKLTIVKVGGAVVEDADSLRALIDQFAAIDGRKMLVHGGGRSATRIAGQMGVETTMIDGRRVTDRPMLDVVTMVYGGLVNKNIVAALQARSINAIGLTGADMDIIRSHRRPANPIDFGFVGDVDRVDHEALSSLVEAGAIPVVAPLSHDGKGSMLNTNADTIASSVAQAMSRVYSTTLIFCFEKPGVLSDPDDDASVIELIDPSGFDSLRADGTVSGGMLPKLDNAFAALKAGVAEVVITNPSQLSLPTAGTHIHL